MAKEIFKNVCRSFGGSWREGLFDVSSREENRACIVDAKKPILPDYAKHVDIIYRLLVDNIKNG